MISVEIAFEQKCSFTLEENKIHLFHAENRIPTLVYIMEKLCLRPFHKLNMNNGYEKWGKEHNSVFVC